MDKIITYRGVKIEIVHNSDGMKEYQVTEYNIGRYGTLKEVYQQIDKHMQAYYKGSGVLGNEITA